MHCVKREMIKGQTSEAPFVKITQWITFYVAPQSLPGGTTYRFNCMMSAVVHDKAEDTMQSKTAACLVARYPINR